MKTYPFVALSVAKSPLFSLPSLEAFAFVFCERGNPTVAILFFSLPSLRGAKRRGNPSLSVQCSGQVLKQEAFQ